MVWIKISGGMATTTNSHPLSLFYQSLLPGHMTGNNDSDGALSASIAGDANVNGNKTTAETAAGPLYSRPICKGLKALPILYMQKDCMGTLHHCCLIEWLKVNGLPEFNLKLCYQCWQEISKNHVSW